MYHIYVTEGLVLNKRAVGEANLVLQVFTREHGLLRIAVKSARLLRSKQRYGLEVATAARFSFVRGRYELKLTGVERANPMMMHSCTQARLVFGRVAKLLLRLVHGPEPMIPLFITMMTGMQLLYKIALENPTDHHMVCAVENVLVLRILAHLGYVSPHIAYIHFIEEEFDSQMVALAKDKHTSLVRIINDSIAQSGL